ncbi:superoxide dismutase [Sinimarinibacterium sp. NLF-5-8]|uniref:superoxide dismutase n=1 Tax=Sinimarinibacterium sp. NLF-5-8 TaxID=2698684 RepID=UPI00137BFD03|nr:Fe-Mn family superoxide dismutase [Sinimarinibacterium sp. NLF-5-8]QHS09905.1 superoxide dismutase [Sinimarinibacterium sp. NLF-5-8]
MALVHPELPYARDALAPHMSAETLDYHYGKHHKAYVDNGNKLIAGTEFENMPIEDIIRKASGGIFNNAAQVWNHSFFWNCLTPKQTAPGKKLTDALVKTFGGVEDFKKQFTASAAGNFGSGWTWLVKNGDGTLAIVNTSNAGSPLTQDQTPLLTCDVWEHAYYIDYRNSRPNYLEHFWALVNWEFVEKNLG